MSQIDLFSVSADASRSFREAVPRPEADAELRWFFNEAESAIDVPSAAVVIAGGESPTSAAAVERRAEAMHAADKINGWLAAIPVGSAMRLGGLYTERPWPEPVVQALGDLAGAVESSPTVRAMYLRALMGAQTRVKSVTAWLAELVEEGGAAAVADWKKEAEMACTIAVREYEHARGTGPCVAPEEVG